MESEEMQKDIEGLIRELMEKEGVDKYELHFEGKSEIGDNYAGEIFFLRVEPEGGKEAYHLVAKTAKRAPEMRKFVPVDLIYDREVFAYGKVFPSFRNLIQDTRSGLAFDFVPKVYAISDLQYKQTLIFENLKTRGFKLHDRKQPWSLEHTLLAMERYGEFHALSLALRDQRPDDFKSLTQQMTNLQAEFMQCFDTKKLIGQPLSATMQHLEKLGRADLVMKYDGIIHEVEDIMIHKVEAENDKIVLGHTDCWNNNFMFKYKDNDESKPTDICFLDFQLLMPSSPVGDLSYNIYTTCDKSSLDHFDLILKTYHTSLSRCLERLGSKPEEIFTFDQLKEHWRKYGKFGILTALMVMKICLIDKEDALDFRDMFEKAESPEALSDGFNIVVKNQEEYNRRVSDVLIHYGDNFL